MLRRYLHLVNLPEADETEAVLVKRGHGDDGQKRQAWAWRRSQGDGQVMDHGNARNAQKRSTITKKRSPIGQTCCATFFSNNGFQQKRHGPVRASAADCRFLRASFTDRTASRRSSQRCRRLALNWTRLASSS
jgi:hypothetical protein